ncbi:MAG: PKD domain-containing protein, partial [Planctomycetota bacterium]
MPLPSVEVIPTSPQVQGLPVTFDTRGIVPGRTAPGGTVVSYNWKVKKEDGTTLTYGDGTAAAETPYGISFVPPAPGNYTMTVTAISPRYLKKTEKTIPIVVNTVLGNFSADQQGSTIYGNAATVAVSGSTNADAGLTYSYDFNNDGDFTDSGEVAESLLTIASYAFPNPGSFKVRVRVKDNLNRFQDYFSVLKVMPTATSAAPVNRNATVFDHPVQVRVGVSRHLIAHVGSGNRSERCRGSRCGR